MTYCSLSGKLWYLQHNCVGDTIVTTKTATYHMAEHKTAVTPVLNVTISISELGHQCFRSCLGACSTPLPEEVLTVCSLIFENKLQHLNQKTKFSLKKMHLKILSGKHQGILWISNYIHNFISEVFTHPCPNFQEQFDLTTIVVRHGWLITPHCFTWI